MLLFKKKTISSLLAASLCFSMGLSIASPTVQAINVTQVADKLMNEYPEMISKWKESLPSLTDQEIKSFVNDLSAKVQDSGQLTESNIGSKLNAAFEQIIKEGKHQKVILAAALSFEVDITTREIPVGLAPMKQVIKEALLEVGTPAKEPTTGGGGAPSTKGDASPTTVPEDEPYSNIVLPEEDKKPVELVFTDIKGHWAEQDILALYEQGILKGNNGKVMPNANITRAEFVTFLVNLLELNEEEEIHFIDAPSTAWYYSNLSKAYKAGLIKGFDTKTIRPNDPITREQMAVIIHEAVKLKGMLTTSENKLVFKDQSKISSWSKEAVEVTSSMGFIRGLNDQTFNPQGKATRAESAALMARLMEKISDKPNTN